MIAAAIWTLDFETVELVEYYAGSGLANVSADVEGSAVNRAYVLGLESAVEARGAKGVTTRLGRHGHEEGRVADGT